MFKKRHNKFIKQPFLDRLKKELEGKSNHQPVRDGLYELESEGKLQLDLRVIASQAKWKMMRASLEIVPNGKKEPSHVSRMKLEVGRTYWMRNIPIPKLGYETAAEAWKRLISEAHEYAKEASYRLGMHLSDSLISRHVAVSEIDVMYIQMQKILYDTSLMLGIKYNNLEKTYRAFFNSVLLISTEEARRKLHELYTERMILSIWDYSKMLYEIDCNAVTQKANSYLQKGRILHNPATLFSMGLRVKEKADEQLRLARKSRNYDEWFINMYRCVPLYGEAIQLFYYAAKGESEGNKKEDYLREEYYVNEMFADGTVIVTYYGLASFLCHEELSEALGRGVEDAKRNALFLYSARPMLPEFAYKAIDHYLSTNDIKYLRDNFMKELRMILIQNLDMDSKILATEAILNVDKEWSQ